MATDPEHIEKELAEQSVVANAYRTKKQLEPVINRSAKLKWRFGCIGCITGCATPLGALIIGIAAAAIAAGGRDLDDSIYALIFILTGSVALLSLAAWISAAFYGLNTEKLDRAKKDMDFVNETLRDA